MKTYSIRLKHPRIAEYRHEVQAVNVAEAFAKAVSDYANMYGLDVAEVTIISVEVVK
jgi:hypothetical protein